MNNKRIILTGILFLSIFAMNCYSIDSDGGMTIQEAIDSYANHSGGDPEVCRQHAEQMYGQFMDNVAAGAYGNTPTSREEVERAFGYGGSSGSPEGASAPAPGPVSPATQPSVPQPAPNGRVTKTEVITGYPHDYETIDDLAKTALSYFTMDGKPDSAYINVNADSKENIVTGELLNLSKKNSENMRISFVSANEMKSEWIFENWESEDDFELDLTSTFEKDESSKYDATYRLDFAQNGTLSGNDVTYRVNTGVSSNTAYIYRVDGDNYTEVAKLDTDENGILELHPDELGSYIVSFTDIISAQKEEKAEKEKAEAERKAKEEAEKLAKESEKQASEAVVEEPSQKTSENVTENVIESLPDEKEPVSIPYVPIGIGVIVFVTIGVLVTKKKKI